MKKRVILIDGNNLLFRSYYATAYANNFMNNSKGFPTNGLYGLVNMLNKIINEEKPEYVMCAFDKGSNFRREMYDDYKAGRITTPDNLKKQFPVAKKLCDYMGIKYIECDNYEADDIIGTFAKMADEDKNFNATIVSSDKDLLQLISDEVEVKLLKQKGYVMMNNKTFYEEYGIEPKKMVDLKALMGDASDNIPGVKGIGEKTALALLQKYGSLDGIYENIESVSPGVKAKLIAGKDNAYFSYKLATIYKDIDFEYTFESIKYNGPNYSNLINLYKELEFNSLLKTIPSMKNENEKVVYEKVEGKLNLDSKNYSTYIECDNSNYNLGKIVGASIYDGNKLYYFDLPSLILNKDLFSDSMVTFDLKKNIVLLNKYNIKIKSSFDTMIVSYLLNYNTKDDIAYLSMTFGTEIEYYDNIFNSKVTISDEIIRNNIVLKAKFLYDSYNDFKDKLIKEELDKLYYEIEHPLIYVLSDMEINGVLVDTSVIDNLKEVTRKKILEVQNNIYEYAGCEFNISSPKQLASILYEKLQLPAGKSNSTAHEVLVKLENKHPIIKEILEYRRLNKLESSYILPFNDYVHSDGKIHTIYKQNVARTGRLSSIEPNLQNIPVRANEGKEIRKAFLAPKGSVLLSSDYSQIELRVLAHITGSKELKNAFINNEDIHRHVASDIFGVDEKDVTSEQRRIAKSVIFGIVYGISGYGLSENLNIPVSEGKKYIEKYLLMYPDVAVYMKDIVNKTKKLGYVRTLFGRKREIDEIKNTNYIIRNMGERIALNTPIQGTAADIIKIAMVKMHEELSKRKLKTKMILQVHDELIFEVPIEEMDTVKEVVKDTMEGVECLSVPLKVDINVGDNWYNAK